MNLYFLPASAGCVQNNFTVTKYRYPVSSRHQQHCTAKTADNSSYPVVAVMRTFVQSKNIDVNRTDINVADVDIDVKYTNIDVTSTNIDVRYTNIDVNDANINVICIDIDVRYTNINVKRTNIDVNCIDIDVKCTGVGTVANCRCPILQF